MCPPPSDRSIAYAPPSHPDTQTPRHPRERAPAAPVCEAAPAHSPPQLTPAPTPAARSGTSGLYLVTCGSPARYVPRPPPVCLPHPGRQTPGVGDGVGVRVRCGGITVHYTGHTATPFPHPVSHPPSGSTHKPQTRISNKSLPQTCSSSWFRFPQQHQLSPRVCLQLPAPTTTPSTSTLPSCIVHDRRHHLSRHRLSHLSPVAASSTSTRSHSATISLRLQHS